MTLQSHSQGLQSPSTLGIHQGAHSSVPSRAVNKTRWTIIFWVLIAFAAITRLVSLDYPTDFGTPVFDEKHYVPQTWQMLASWQNPLIGGIEDNPGYGLVVHPPLGKEIPLLGQALFGYTPWGWRITSALLGIAVVALVATIARRITRSDFIGMIAGILALFDGVFFVSARTAMLDNYQLFFILLGTLFLLNDDRQVKQAFTSTYLSGSMPDLGPRFGIRWWRFATGICLGCALSIKWSGLYYMAAAGLALVVIDFVRRRHYGVARPFWGTFLFSALPSFCAVVLLPVAVYILSWRAWFASETGVDRHYFTTDSSHFFTQLATACKNFVYMHSEMMSFHTSLTNSAGYQHPWESKPWMWIFGLRPVLYYSSTDSKDRTALQYLFGTPIIWWLVVPVILYGLYRLIAHHDWRWTIPIVGFMAGFLPWFLNPDRQMYFFYAVNLAPFIILGLSLCLGQLTQWGWKPASSNYFMSHTGICLCVIYIVAVVTFFFYFMPILTGMPLTSFEKYIRLWFSVWT